MMRNRSFRLSDIAYRNGEREARIRKITLSGLINSLLSSLSPDAPDQERGKSFCYFAKCEGLIKIGKSCEPIRRTQFLAGGAEIIALFDECDLTEAAAHEHFKAFRHHGEYFSISEAFALKAIADIGVQPIPECQFPKSRKRTGISISEDVFNHGREQAERAGKDFSRYLESLILADIDASKSGKGRAA